MRAIILFFLLIAPASTLCAEPEIIVSEKTRYSEIWSKLTKENGKWNCETEIRGSLPLIRTSKSPAALAKLKDSSAINAQTCGGKITIVLKGGKKKSGCSSDPVWRRTIDILDNECGRN